MPDLAHYRQHLLTLILVAWSAVAASGPSIIFDTDLGGDADDLGALAMLHNLATAGECELLAVMSWSTERFAVPAIRGMNEYYGHAGIPVGVRQGDSWHAPWQYGKAVADSLGSTHDEKGAPDATTLYRKILASQPDASVTIVTVGPLANIRNLLASPGDDISPLAGRDLVREKVERFVIMGGQFPAGDEEWNFFGDMPGVTREVLDEVEAPIVFSGYEIGEVVRTGPAIAELGEDHPLYAGYLHFSEHAPWMKDRFQGHILDNASYDQTAVLYAVRGGLGGWWALSEPGRVVADATGGNRFTPDPDGRHRYLKMTAPPEAVESVIRQLMLGKAP